jgi:hypothetical protein
MSLPKIKRTTENIKAYTVNINKENINFSIAPFTNDFLRQNHNWRDSKNIEGCVYVNPNRGLRHINQNEWVYVFESNMETNSIEGMGIIKKINPKINEFKIYKERNRNRYGYEGKYYLNKDILNDIDNNFIKKIETLIFTGYWHMKRGQGLSTITNRIVKINKDIRRNDIEFTEFCKKVNDELKKKELKKRN